jgi:Domain of unknown function (DUF4189)
MPSVTPVPVAPAPVAAAPPQDDDDSQYIAAALSIANKQAAYGMAGADEQARTLALYECKSHTGDDLCIVVESTHNGCVAAVFNASGSFAGGRGPDPASARRAALAKLPDNNYVAEPVCSK